MRHETMAGRTGGADMSERRDCMTCELAPSFAMTMMNCKHPLGLGVRLIGKDKVVWQGGGGVVNCCYWQPKEPKPYFADANVGNEVYSMRYGQLRIVEVPGRINFFLAKDRHACIRQFYPDGRHLKIDAEQTVFWAKPEIIPPPKPKRKREYAGTKTLHLRRKILPNGVEVYHITMPCTENWGDLVAEKVITEIFEWEE